MSIPLACERRLSRVLIIELRMRFVVAEISINICYYLIEEGILSYDCIKEWWQQSGADMKLIAEVLQWLYESENETTATTMNAES